jgi:hypothetical protein
MIAVNAFLDGEILLGIASQRSVWVVEDCGR